MSKFGPGDTNCEDRNPRPGQEELIAPRIADKETLKTLKVVRLKGKGGPTQNDISDTKNPFASLVTKATPLASVSPLKSNGLPTAVKQFSFNFNKSFGDPNAEPLTLQKGENASSSTEGAAPKFNFNFGAPTSSANASKSMFNFATAAATFTTSKVETQDNNQIDPEDWNVDPSCPPTTVKNTLMSSSIITEQIDSSQKILGEILQCDLFVKGEGKEWNDCGSGSVSLIKKDGKAPEVIMHANLTKRLLLQVSVDRTFGVLSKSETSVVFYAPKVDPNTKEVKPVVWRIKFIADVSSKAFIEVLTKENAEKSK